VRLLLTVVMTLAGCGGERVAPGAAALVAPELVRGQTVWRAPPGADGAERYRVTWSPGGGGPGSLAVAHVPRLGAGAALVDPARRLYAVWPDGQRRMLAEGVFDLAVSGDGALLAFAVAAPSGGEVRLWSGSARPPRAIATGLSSAGALRFSPDGAAVLYVGAEPGGIAGLRVAGVGGGADRCLTNCALRTGQAWLDRFVPPPGAAEELVFEGAEVRWRDRRGVPRSVAWEAAP